MIQSINKYTKPNPLHVLVVEDDFVFNTFYKNFLGNKGAVVTSCLSLNDAKSLLDDDSLMFDAVILDNQLTDGEGISLIPYITARERVPAIIMVSGNDDPEFFLSAFTAGINDYMVKPVNLELLHLKINNSVNQLRLSRLSAQQHAELELWVEQERQQQILAKHLFDTMFLDINQQHSGIHVWMQPSGVFSGDAMLRCLADDGSWYFVLADAMGHGLAPAISLMPLMQRFQMLAAKATPLSNIVFDLNGALNELLPADRFVAAILMRFNPWQNELEVWNAGMPALQCLDAKGQLISVAISSNMALGVLSNHQISVLATQISLADVSYLLMHSDGLTETTLASGDTLASGTISSLLNLGSPSPFKPIAEVFQNVVAEDDISLCLIDCAALLCQTVNDTAEYSLATGTFTADFRLQGTAMIQTDLPTKAIELLRSQNLPLVFVQRVFTVLTELYINALEHGVLGLDSSIKELEDGFIQFYEEKERRLDLLCDHQFIEVQLHWSATEKTISIKILDSGTGFTPEVGHTKSILGEDNAKPDAFTPAQAVSHGRGLKLIQQLTTHFEVVAPGNCSIVKLSLQ
jgi:CheY-like chemotaxis protein